MLAAEEPEFRVETVGVRVHRGTVAFEATLGQRAITNQAIVDVRQGKDRIVRASLVAEFAKDLPDVILREVTKAVFGEPVAREKIVEVAFCPAGLDERTNPAETTIPHFRDRARVGAPAFSLYYQRATQCVPAAHRIRAGNQLSALNRIGRNEVPIHLVGQRFVDPNAIDKHAQSWRSAQEKRAGEAVVDQVGLKRVVLYIGERNSGEVTGKEIGAIQRAARAVFLSCHHLYVYRNLHLR